MRVTLYTQPDCGLCHDAEAMLRRIGGKIRLELELVNVNVNSSAYASYGERIPVIAVNGEEVAAAPLDERRLTRLLKSWGTKNPS